MGDRERCAAASELRLEGAGSQAEETVYFVELIPTIITIDSSVISSGYIPWRNVQSSFSVPKIRILRVGCGGAMPPHASWFVVARDLIREGEGA